ncbi:MAG: electron transfer flavoprotein subunit beta/FixA family protein [Nitrososphaerales archaeon]
MEVIVCLKHVVDETQLKVDRANNKIIFEGAKTKISDDDKNAIEEAVKIKEKNGGTVTAICLGSTDAKKSLKEALAMGCDKGRLLVDTNFQDMDAIRTALVISRAIKKIGKYDLVITSTGTTDVYSGVVGPSIAEFLQVPELGFVSKLEIVAPNKVKVERLLEEGVEIVECETPLVLTVVREINQPRFPTLIQIMGAGKKEMIEWDAKALEIDTSSIGKSGSKVHVDSVDVPKSARKKLLFESSPEEASEKLADALLKEGVVK